MSRVGLASAQYCLVCDVHTLHTYTIFTLLLNIV
jgi:hypothetical protein